MASFYSNNFCPLPLKTISTREEESGGMLPVLGFIANWPTFNNPAGSPLSFPPFAGFLSCFASFFPFLSFSAYCWPKTAWFLASLSFSC
jgi:glycopeptide antibiotics resistance protein